MEYRVSRVGWYRSLEHLGDTDRWSTAHLPSAPHNVLYKIDIVLIILCFLKGGGGMDVLLRNFWLCIMQYYEFFCIVRFFKKNVQYIFAKKCNTKSKLFGPSLFWIIFTKKIFRALCIIRFFQKKTLKKRIIQNRAVCIIRFFKKKCYILRYLYVFFRHV